jgi:hypothetical protein
MYMMLGVILFCPQHVIPATTEGSGAVQAGISRVRVYDVLGVCVLTHPLAPSREGESVRLDVSGLAAGVYFVKIDNKMYKFVKMLRRKAEHP